MQTYRPHIEPLAIPKLHNVELAVLRDDTWGGPAQGNKWRKLRLNLEAYRTSGKEYLLSFGGAFSNHMYAIAFAAGSKGIPLRMVVRGEEPLQYSPTLADSRAFGAELHFVSRSEYRRLCTAADEELEAEFPGAFVVPEGGNNAAGAAGCGDIADIAAAAGYSHVCVAFGTGTTAAGIIQRARQHKLVTCVYPVLKGINPPYATEEKVYWQNQWHFGGYARVTEELLHFGLEIYRLYGIPLDPVYTAKLFYGVCRDAENEVFPAGSRVLLYHSGGMQGARGFESYYKSLTDMGFSLG